MDPKAAFYLICDLIQQGETEEAYYAARDLEQWLVRGGFYPELTADDQKTALLAIFNLLSYARPK